MVKRVEAFAALGISGYVSEVGKAFREFVHEQVRGIIIGVMTAEVECLCGRRHQPKVDGEFFRAGLAPGYVLHEGRRQDVKRPRVRRCDGEGGSREAAPAGYAEARELGELRRRVLDAL